MEPLENSKTPTSPPHQPAPPQSEQILRFALLLHSHITGPDALPHWDLLLELDPASPLLPTWSFATNPLAPPSSALSATRLPDHRRHYLTYEGPISQNRGTVQRLASGTLKVLIQSPTQLSIQLNFPTSHPLSATATQIQATHWQWHITPTSKNPSHLLSL